MKTTIALLATLIAGCAGSGFSPTPQYDLAAQRARGADQDDVRFCEYEASKVPSNSQNRNMIVQAVDNQEERMRVFNACLTYKGYR